MRKQALIPCFALLLAALCMPAAAQLRYDTEYPAIGYSTAELNDPVTGLVRRIEAGEVTLRYAEGRGYLDSLLEVLDIDPNSQVLVFSKTSLKNRFITSHTPRAVYFNDEVYVGLTLGSNALEIGAMDPNLGPVFFDMPNRLGDAVAFERQMGRCLRCHDSYGLSGGGVPRFILSSNLAGEDGSIVSHELSEITTTATPIQRRWGGFYVTGTHGALEHMGNLVLRDVPAVLKLDLSLTGNKRDLSEFLDLTPYPSVHSDITALLVLEHQVEVQNLITRVNYDARTLLDAAGMNAETEARLAEIAEPLVRSLLMADEAPLSDAVQGTSGFAEGFQARGPFDARGRSLRELDLKTRTFKYPLSYLIHSKAFLALPEAVKAIVFGRVEEALAGGDGALAHLDADLRGGALGILRDTHPEFARWADAER